MPRKHKRRLGSRKYHDFSNETLEKALDDVIKTGLSFREASEKYGIPKSTLHRKRNKQHTRPVGRPTAFTQEMEQIIVHHLVKVSEWGFPFSRIDLRHVGKSILDQKGMVAPVFKDNLPGDEWAQSFLRRHGNLLTRRLCQSIKSSRANVSAETIKSYFINLEDSLNGVPAKNIMNYDETNLSDDPGRQKLIFKRGVRYPERIMNSSKSATSSGAARGGVLGVETPPFQIHAVSKRRVKALDIS